MPKASKCDVPIETIRKLFTYDPITGDFVRVSDGIICISGPLIVCGERHETSRYIWAHYYGEWPPLDMLIDHKDRDRSNTKLENLRLATHPQNGFNMTSYSPYGYKGVTFDASRQKSWRAQIRIDGRKVNLGRFFTIEEAALAYQQASIKHHGEFANHD